MTFFKFRSFSLIALNCQKQELEFQTALKDLINGNLTIIDQSFCSIILTNIIENLILRSTLANEYLGSQYLIINQIEYSLPLIKNFELENELLTTNETFLISNPFTDFNELEDYLNRCERKIKIIFFLVFISFFFLDNTTTIPSYPIQQSHPSSMYYSSYHSSQYYYPPTEMNNYYYNSPPIYPNSQQQIYPYGQSTAYYQPPSTYNNNNPEQFKYYYPQQQIPYPYASQSNSTNDIPSLSTNPSISRPYRTMNSNIPR